MNSSTKEVPSELEFASQESTEFAGRHVFERSRFLTEIKPSELQIWHLENRTEKKIWHNSFKNLLQKLLKMNLQSVMLSTEKPFFDWNQTFRAPILTSQESNREENFTQLIQEFAPKAVQTEFALCHAFKRETVFWLKWKLQSSDSHLKNRKEKKIWTINSRICSKNYSNWICASCFREKTVC